MVSLGTTGYVMLPQYPEISADLQCLCQVSIE